MMKFGIRHILLYSFILVTLLFYSCTYRSVFSKKLCEKSLIYCLRDDFGGYRPLYEIIEIQGDSIYKAGSRADSLQEWYYLKNVSNNTSGLYVPFQIPYMLKRKGNLIMLSCNASVNQATSKRIYNQVQYSYNIIDSVSCINLSNLCAQEIGYSKYLKDTVIVFKNQKLFCSVFREYYLKKRFYPERRDMTITRYIEKSTLLPIRTNFDFFEAEGFRLPAVIENRAYVTLDSIIHKDSLRKYLEVRTMYCQ